MIVYPSSDSTMRSGFTLVEIAIVLVIIGLLVGGVLTGQDLIKAAEINRSIADLEKYNAGAVTFRNKFGGLPGDLSTRRASLYGMTPRDGSPGHGDANDLVEGCGWREAALGCETGLFWVDLTRAELINQAFDVGGRGLADGNTEAANVALVDDMTNFVPSIAIRKSAFVHVIPVRDRNYYLIANFTTDANGDVVMGPPFQAMTAFEADQFDNKIDDGNPHGGRVQAVSAVSATAGGTTQDAGADPAATGECVYTGLSRPVYNTVNREFSDELNCGLRVTTAF